MAYPLARSMDPRDLAPVGSYFTDGDVLVQILEADWTGVDGENICDGQTIRITRDELRQRWRRTRPASDEEVAAWLTSRR